MTSDAEILFDFLEKFLPRFFRQGNKRLHVSFVNWNALSYNFLYIFVRSGGQWRSGHARTWCLTETGYVFLVLISISCQEAALWASLCLRQNRSEWLLRKLIFRRKLEFVVSLLFCMRIENEIVLHFGSIEMFVKKSFCTKVRLKILILKKKKTFFRYFFYLFILKKILNI